MYKKKKFSIRAQARPNSDINVTPLVDVVLVLLIIFMVMTPLMEKMLRVRVPDAETEPTEAPPAQQLVVSVSAEGDIAINSEKVLDGDYIDRLKRVLAARAVPDRLVFFAADDKARYPRLVTALDGARRAGAQILTMTTEPMAAATATNTPPATLAAPP